MFYISHLQRQQASLPAKAQRKNPAHNGKVDKKKKRKKNAGGAEYLNSLSSRFSDLCGVVCMRHRFFFIHRLHIWSSVCDPIQWCGKTPHFKWQRKEKFRSSHSTLFTEWKWFFRAPKCTDTRGAFIASGHRRYFLHSWSGSIARRGRGSIARVTFVNLLPRLTKPFKSIAGISASAIRMSSFITKHAAIDFHFSIEYTRQVARAKYRSQKNGKLFYLTSLPFGCFRINSNWISK